MQGHKIEAWCDSRYRTTAVLDDRGTIVIRPQPDVQAGMDACGNAALAAEKTVEQGA
jgi:hypothetical protein